MQSLSSWTNLLLLLLTHYNRRFSKTQLLLQSFPSSTFTAAAFPANPRFNFSVTNQTRNRLRTVRFYHSQFQTFINQSAQQSLTKSIATTFSRNIMTSTSSSSANSADITKTLDKLHLAPDQYTLTTHDKVETAEQHTQFCQGLNGIQLKNLLLKDKKLKKLFCVSMPVNAKIDLKLLAKELGCGEMRFSDDVTKVLSIPKGSLSPLALLNDVDNQITLILPTQFKSSTESVLIHPLQSDATISVKLDKIVQLLIDKSKTIIYVDFDKLKPEPKKDSISNSSSAAAAAPKQKKDKSSNPQTSSTAVTASSAAASKIASSKNQDGMDKDKYSQFSSWYVQLVTRGELVEYYDISGCYILRPWSYSIWEIIQSFLDKSFKSHGVSNCYFPCFVSKKSLEREASHIEGFAPEVAWVTKSGNTALDEEIAIRPTSETIMYPAYSKWVRSHRDLPLLLNQWNSVVRWEFKFPTPFIRSREFLWQEGHTAHANQAESDDFVMKILEVYRSAYEDWLAVPVIPGKKTEVEKFAGGHYTTTVEAFIPGIGRGIQGATSHSLGVNFAKMFNITYESEYGTKEFVHQTSWGFTTRVIGVMIMIHSDNYGLVLPPKMAPIQIVIIPIIIQKKKDNGEFDSDPQAIIKKCEEIKQTLLIHNFRVHLDDRDCYTPGWKYNYWELKGVPIRCEIGPNDFKTNSCVLHRRDLRDKTKAIKVQNDVLPAKLHEILETQQKDMFERALKEQNERKIKVENWNEFMAALNKRNFILAPHCETRECELEIKKKSGEAQPEEEDNTQESQQNEAGEKLTGAAKSLCIPFKQPDLKLNTKCVNCTKSAKHYTLFGRSY